MDIVVDDTFKAAYDFYYGQLRATVVLNTINGSFDRFDTELVNDAINIIKASMVIGYTYTECRDKVFESILHRFPVSGDIEKFVLNLVLKVMIASGSESVTHYVKAPRNINREVAAKQFRVPESRVTEEMVQVVLEASDRFEETSYSVEDPRVKNWDEYFYEVAKTAARNSKCLSRRIGAVLVRDKSIISTGYNGPPRGIPRCDLRWDLDEKFADKYKDQVAGKETTDICPRYVIGFASGQGLELCPAGHAERNTLINAVREGHNAKDATLYMTCGIPCTPCLVEIINAGVKDIVVTSLNIYDETARYLLEQGDLSVRLFSFVK